MIKPPRQNLSKEIEGKKSIFSEVWTIFILDKMENLI